jgi:hypothetical protein
MKVYRYTDGRISGVRVWRFVYEPGARSLLWGKRGIGKTGDPHLKRLI